MSKNAYQDLLHNDLEYHLRKLFDIYDMLPTVENRADRIKHFRFIGRCLNDYEHEFKKQSVLDNMAEYIGLVRHALDGVEKRFLHPDSELSIGSSTAHIFCFYIQHETLRLRHLAMPKKFPTMPKEA